MLTAQYTPALSVNDSLVLSHDMVSSAIASRDSDALSVYADEAARVGACDLAADLRRMARSLAPTSFERGMSIVAANIGDFS